MRLLHIKLFSSVIIKTHGLKSTRKDLFGLTNPISVLIALPMPPMGVSKDYFGLDHSGGAEGDEENVSDIPVPQLPPPRLPPPPGANNFLDLFLKLK